MKADEAYAKMRSQFALDREVVLSRIAWLAGMGMSYATFMEHELSSPIRDELKAGGFALRRVKGKKVEVSWGD